MPLVLQVAVHVPLHALVRVLLFHVQGQAAKEAHIEPYCSEASLCIRPSYSYPQLLPLSLSPDLSFW